VPSAFITQISPLPLPLLLTNLVQAIRSTGLVAAVVSGGAVVAVFDGIAGRAVVLDRCVAVTGAADTAGIVVVLPALLDDKHAPASKAPTMTTGTVRRIDIFMR
jgi:hypothetical protein